MCGRYAITTVPDAIRQLFRYLEQPNFPARYNIAPSQPVPVVRLENGARHFALVRWGLIPSWVKDPKTVSLLFNARAETVNEKPAFKNAMKRRRCLLPADGFFEWKRSDPSKHPYFIRRGDGAPMAFAGIWETWMGPNGEEMETAAIITTQANTTLGTIHDRMPVILQPETFDVWLSDATELETATNLLAPLPDDHLNLFPVTKAVNRVANDGPRNIERLTAPEPEEVQSQARPKKRSASSDSGQGTLF